VNVAYETPRLAETGSRLAAAANVLVTAPCALGAAALGVAVASAAWV
jgi:CrcB protein